MTKVVNNFDPSTSGSFFSALDTFNLNSNDNISSRYVRKTTSHAEQGSNPFSMLYRNELSENVLTKAQAMHLNRYATIDRQFSHDEGEDTRQAPIELLPQNEGLTRTGSVISRTVERRNKNSIRRRNKMLKKSDLSISPLNTNIESKKISKFRFIFPAKKKSSLKKQAEHKPGKANFPSSHELSGFLNSMNIAELSLELIPKDMLFYYYTRLYLPLPKLRRLLTKIERLDSIARAGSKKKGASGRFVPSAPIQSTLMKNGEPYKAVPNSDQLFNSQYSNFRKSIFSKGIHDPRALDVEAESLSRFELNEFNKILLFEVLLRRILAAKIKYRLENNYYTSPSVYSESINSSSLSLQPSHIISN